MRQEKNLTDSEVTTWHLHIQGQVQGVGFRPFVYRQAMQCQLKGWVNNSLDGVHIEFNATEETARAFCESVLADAPSLARITDHELSSVAPKAYGDFQITHSTASGDPQLLLSPDFALCEACREEVFDTANRRAAYPFITCTLCGPRFSIVKSLPYDRPTTTMAPFQQCPTCQAEYDNVLDRRYYSQTNSCPECAIQLILYDTERNLIAEDSSQCLEQVVQHWREGKVVAIKGIGGYLLTCDATQADAVHLLRQRKHRPTKPFAVMYPGLASLRKDAEVSTAEAELLEGPVSPIVLVQLRSQPTHFLALSAIAPRLDQLGVMLPYTPLYALLLEAFGQPIVATSGNLTNAPIVFQDEQALQELTGIADFVLVNNREIVVPQDDSVVRFTPTHQQRIILRRSRGWAPTYTDVEVVRASKPTSSTAYTDRSSLGFSQTTSRHVYINSALNWPTESILATGADMKSAFGLLHQGNVYLSQYLGDLSHYNTELSYQHTLQHVLAVFYAQPNLILSDKHPGYASTRYATELAEKGATPQQQFQHHIAHFGAILGEHQLLHSTEPILGVIWDGTGLGDDGQIWGGEFFVYTDFQFKRQGHLSYFDAFLGDKMPREPRLSAVSLAKGIPEAEGLLRAKFTEQEWSLYTRLLDRKSNLGTSSAGRLFDGVASLLGLMDRQTYEGEAALQLEQLGRRFFDRQPEGLRTPMESYWSETLAENTIQLKTVIQGVIKDLVNGQPKPWIAARFHYSLAILVRQLANKWGIQKIAFSGGVMQNGLLVDLLIEHLKADFELYFHEQLSPNDENIAFGQLVCYQIERTHEKLNCPRVR